MARADFKSALRNVPVHCQNWSLLGLEFNGSYYIDTCLPFGCSVSCALFEKFATFLDWYT